MEANPDKPDLTIEYLWYSNYLILIWPQKGAKNTNTKYQTNSNDQNSQPTLMILKKERSNDLVIVYWDLGFYCILVLGI